MIGTVYGYLKVNKLIGSKNKNRIWECLCICGKTVNVSTSSLNSGNNKSCGCMKHIMVSKCNTVHGKSGTKTHNNWMAMIRRCKSNKNKCFAQYGGRGITVCERWLNFENFLADMGMCPEGLEIDRINNDGNYEPGNCRWTTHKENMKNQWNTIRITHRLKTKTLKEWSTYLGIKYSTLYARYMRGDKPNEILRALVR